MLKRYILSILILAVACILSLPAQAAGDENMTMITTHDIPKVAEGSTTVDYSLEPLRGKLVFTNLRNYGIDEGADSSRIIVWWRLKNGSEEGATIILHSDRIDIEVDTPNGSKNVIREFVHTVDQYPEVSVTVLDGKAYLQAGTKTFTFHGGVYSLTGQLSSSYTSGKVTVYKLKY